MKKAILALVLLSLRLSARRTVGAGEKSDQSLMSLPRPQPRGSALRVLLLTTGYALLHSLLASAAAKQLARQLAGRRYRDGLYRAFYVGQATLVTVAAIRVFVRLPDRELYRAGTPWKQLLWSVQLGGFVLLASAVNVVGWLRLTGIQPAAALLSGQEPGPAPEAQGPPLDATGRIDARGPFRSIRHPDNLPIVLVLCAFPRMTVNRLVLAIVASVYAIVGSWHEDRRLRAAYGVAFDEYRRRVPMMLPKLTK